MIKGQHLIAAFTFGCFLLATFGCRRNSDAALQQRLVGTWRFASVDGNFKGATGDLTFTVTTNGEYISQITIPEAHSIRGLASVENGIMIVTVTNRDNIAVRNHQHQTIVRCDGEELVILPEGSDMAIHFRKLEQTHVGP